MLLQKVMFLLKTNFLLPFDTTVRKVVIDNLPFLLSDTVGFIRKLPTQLVESFKSTLVEVQEADLLLHVVDISHHNFEEHIQSVNQILSEIKSIDKPTLMVFNKIDAYLAEPWDESNLLAERTSKHYSIEEWEKTWMHRVNDRALFISALNKENLDAFRERVYAEIRKIHITRFPYNHFLYDENGSVLSSLSFGNKSTSASKASCRGLHAT